MSTSGARWSRTGRWDDAHSIVLKYQTRDGGPGRRRGHSPPHADGAAVLVDRGWLATGNVGNARPDLPRATTGDVTVTGWVRLDGSGGSTEITDLAARAVSSTAAAKVVPYPLYGGFLDLHTETPGSGQGAGRRSSSPTTPARGRTSSTGCSGGSSAHWRSSASATSRTTSGVVRRRSAATRPRCQQGPRAQSDRTMPPSTGSIAPVTNDDSGLSRNTAAAANSAGSP